MITIAYVISGALTAISGIIFAFYTNSVSPANHGNAYELYGIAAAVLGGITSIPGAVLGGLLLGLIEQLAAGYLHSSIQDVVPFLVIMLALSLLPTGLLGARGLRKV